jgi:PqqD family protein of HPr-rel-A system
MPDSSNAWEINPTSRLHFREWPEGVAVYLEGEGGTYLLNPFAADLLKWLIASRLSTHAIAEKLLSQYPDDTLENVIHIVEQTLGELRTRGMVVRVEQ